MPLATLPGCGPITRHLEGPHSHIKCHGVKVFVQTNPQTRLQHAQDNATIVPVNDTRTQCTTSLPPHKGAAALKRTKNGTESQRKIKSRNHQRVGPAPTKAFIIIVVAALVHNLQDHPRRFGTLNVITPRT